MQPAFPANLVGLLVDKTSSSSLFAVSALDGAVTLALICLCSSLSHLCHFNPAVTLAATLTGQLKLVIGVALMFSQVFGSFFGAVFTRVVLSSYSYADLFTALGLLRPLFASYIGPEQPSAPGTNANYPLTSPPPPLFLVNVEASEESGALPSRLQLFALETVLSTMLIIPYTLQTARKERLSLLTFGISVAAMRVCCCVELRG